MVVAPRPPVRADSYSGAGGADALAEKVPLVPGAAGEGVQRAQAGLAATDGARRIRLPARPREWCRWTIDRWYAELSFSFVLAVSCLHRAIW